MPRKKTSTETEEERNTVMDAEIVEQTEAIEETDDMEIEEPVRKKAAPGKNNLKNKILGRAKKKGAAESQPSIMFYLHALFLLGGRILTSLLDIYNSAVGLSPRDKAKIYRNVSNHYINKGMHQKAIDSLKEWSRLDPENPEPPYQLALALAAAGRYKQAIIVLNKVLKMDPNHTGAIYRKGKLLLKRKEYAEAVAEFEPLIKTKPDNPEIHYLLSVAYSRLDQVKDAVQAMEKAVALAPEESKYYQFLGFLYEREGEHQKAATCFSKVMELEEQGENEQDDLD